MLFTPNIDIASEFILIVYNQPLFIDFMLMHRFCFFLEIVSKTIPKTSIETTHSRKKLFTVTLSEIRESTRCSKWHFIWHKSALISSFCINEHVIKFIHLERFTCYQKHSVYMYIYKLFCFMFLFSISCIFRVWFRFCNNNL